MWLRTSASRTWTPPPPGIEPLGGKVWVQPKDIPNVGRFAVAGDPTGALFARFK